MTPLRSALGGAVTAPTDGRAGEARSVGVPLAAGGVAGVLASFCCVGPLVLVLAGVGGASVSVLQAFEPYRPLFLGAAALALAFAWGRIYRRAAQCSPGEVCALPAVRRGQKAAFWLVGILVLASGAVPYVAPLFY
jgi:mercuric ion transport protein